jgi:protein-tyrosine phosphatase
MGRIYAAAGYERVVATPHCMPGSAWTPAPDDVRDRTRTLNRRLGQEGVALEVLPGMEVALDPGVLDMIDRQAVAPLGGSRCLLIEPPFQRLPLGWRQVLAGIRARGFEVLLAHPERCAELMRHAELFDELAAEQVYLQVNWSSLIGHHGPEAETLAWALVLRGYVHCLATDGHDARFRNAGVVKIAAEAVADKLGPGNLALMSRENPARLLAGKRPLGIGPGRNDEGKDSGSRVKGERLGVMGRLRRWMGR